VSGLVSHGRSVGSPTVASPPRGVRRLHAGNADSQVLGLLGLELEAI